MSCETCKNKPTTPESVPYIVHESAIARMERTNKRLWITNLILIFLLVGAIIGFAYYENQFEDVVTTIEAEQDGSGVNIVSGGDLDYGAESEGNNP